MGISIQDEYLLLGNKKIYLLIYFCVRLVHQDSARNFLERKGSSWLEKNPDEKHQFFDVLGGAEDQFQPSKVDLLGFLDYSLHFLYKCKGKPRETKKIHFGGLKLILKPT